MRQLSVCAVRSSGLLSLRTAPSPNALRLPRPVPQNICGVKGHHILGNETCGQTRLANIPNTVLPQHGLEICNCSPLSPKPFSAMRHYTHFLPSISITVTPLIKVNKNRLKINSEVVTFLMKSQFVTSNILNSLKCKGIYSLYVTLKSCYQ